MTPTLDDLQFLQSDIGARWLARLSENPITPDNHLKLATRLRKTLTPNQAQAVLEMALLRQLGAIKFSKAAEMFFTRSALEQASSEPVASHRAKRFSEFEQIADLGCSIGGDALGLTEVSHVTGVEWDPVRLAMAQENVAVYGRSGNFSPLQADIQTLTPQPQWQAVFFDPGRRDERGRRFFSVHHYQPPLSEVQRWQVVISDTAVKVSPGIDYSEIPPDAEIEFVSYNGEVKEGILWFGGLHSGVQRRATCLPGAFTITSDEATTTIPVEPMHRFLYEPDGAVIRAHLVEALAAQIGAAKIDNEIAYLSADTAVDTPFAVRYEIEAVMPFQLKRLRQALHQRQIGSVTVKKRGSPISPEQLQQQLRLDKNQPNHAIIFLTFVAGNPVALIGRRESP